MRQNTLPLQSVLPFITAGALMLMPGCLVATVSQERAGPDRVVRPLWHPVHKEVRVGIEGTRPVQPSYVAFDLDHAKLGEILAQAPRQHPHEAGTGGIEVTLPWPDGSFAVFRVAEMVAEEPALQCPDVKAYLGHTDDRLAHARLEWSAAGLAAKLSTSGGAAHIRPHTRQGKRLHLVYYEQDYRSVAALVGDEPPAPIVTPSAPPFTAADLLRPPPSPTAIEEIGIEQWCFHCDSQYTLRFRRDGTASLTKVGVLGLGVLDQNCGGRVTPADFAALATLMHQEGFLGLDEVYRSRAVDGRSVKTTVIANGKRKAVENSNDEAAPAKLKMIEKAIKSLAAKVTWAKKPA